MLRLPLHLVLGRRGLYLLPLSPYRADWALAIFLREAADRLAVLDRLAIAMGSTIPITRPMHMHYQCSEIKLIGPGFPRITNEYLADYL